MHAKSWGKFTKSNSAYIYIYIDISWIIYVIGRCVVEVSSLIKQTFLGMCACVCASIPASRSPIPV